MLNGILKPAGQVYSVGYEARFSSRWVIGTSHSTAIATSPLLSPRSTRTILPSPARCIQRAPLPFRIHILNLTGVCRGITVALLINIPPMLTFLVTASTSLLVPPIRYCTITGYSMLNRRNLRAFSPTDPFAEVCMSVSSRCFDPAKTMGMTMSYCPQSYSTVSRSDKKGAMVRPRSRDVAGYMPNPMFAGNGNQEDHSANSDGNRVPIPFCEGSG